MVGKLMLVLGFAGQAVFASRFLIQWIYSERAKRSVIPEIFWYISLCGSSLLLIYAIYRKDMVFILGQSSGFIVYLRNIYLLKHGKNAQKPKNMKKTKKRS